MMCQNDERSIELFLDLLDRSVEAGACEPVKLSTMQEIKASAKGVAVDLDAPIEGAIEI